MKFIPASLLSLSLLLTSAIHAQNVGVGTTTPVSKLEVAGSIGSAIQTVSAATTLDATYSTVLATPGSAYTITLPAVATSTRRIYTIVYNGAAGGNTITIKGNASENIITGATSANTYLLKGGSVNLQSNGTSWYVTIDAMPAVTGTVTGVSVVTTNGLAGTVATPTTTPVITLSTTATGMLKGNGTAISGVTGTPFGAAYWSDANTVGTTAAGTAGQILQSNGAAAPTWINANSLAWGLKGNSAITQPAVPATYGTSTFGSTENFVGNTDAKDLAFGTGNIERMRILSTGNVGIGTAAPTALLDVTGASGADAKMNVLNTGTGNTGIEIRAAAAGSLQYIDFANSSTANSGAGTPDFTNRIISGSSSLVFSTNTAANAVTLFNNGSLSVGTTSSLNQLAVNNASMAAGTANSYALGIIRSGSADLTLGSDATNAYIQSWNSKPLVINSQGNPVNFSNTGSTITVSNLAGTGNRPVIATSTGLLKTTSATVDGVWNASANLCFSRDDMNNTAAGTNGTTISVAHTGSSIDDAVTGVNLPYSIYINGTGYNWIGISSNGYIEFNTSNSWDAATTYTNGTLPSTSFTMPVLCAYWDDMKTTGNGVRYFTIGDAGNRVTIIDYELVTVASTYAMTFQVQLHEGSNLMSVKYVSMNGNATGQLATIGFQLNNTTAIPITCNAKVLEDNAANTQSVSFCPSR